MHRYRQVSGFILAGGVSSRMGRDKALLDFGGIPLILHTARLLEPLVRDATVVGTPDRYEKLGLRAIADDAKLIDAAAGAGAGPLAGIASALAATHSPWNLIVACDLPYLSAEWLDWLLSRAVRSHAKAVIPRTEHGIEPLAALYRRECAAPIAAAFARGVRKVSEAVDELRIEFVQPLEWRRVVASELILQNMNVPGDYEKARDWWNAERLTANDYVTKVSPAPRRKRRSVPRPSK